MRACMCTCVRMYIVSSVCLHECVFAREDVCMHVHVWSCVSASAVTVSLQYRLTLRRYMILS